MDYIKEFDIRLEREMYYAGEIMTGRVILSTTENFKLKGKFVSEIPHLSLHAILRSSTSHKFQVMSLFSTLSLPYTL